MFKIKIITKTGTLETDIKSEDITIPTEKGPVNILAKHTHMISIISMGVISITTQTEVKQYYITKGICKVFETDLTILCEHCESKKDINIDSVQKDISKYTKKLEYKNIHRKDYEANYKKLKEATFRLEVASS